MRKLAIASLLVAGVALSGVVMAQTAAPKAQAAAPKAAATKTRLSMTIYNLYIFDRTGKCLMFRGWNQKVKSKGAIEREKKLMFGLLYECKSFVNKMSPRVLDEAETEPLYSFTTRDYKLHYLETASGLRFALTTDPSVGKITDTLSSFYRLYVDFVVKNPLHRMGGPINTPLFVTKLEALVEGLPFF